MRKVFYACNGRKRVGVATVAIDENFSSCYINSIFIKPDFQRRGFGTKLLNRIISLCRKMKLSNILLRADSSLKRWYRRNGFIGGKNGNVMELSLV
jgi:ribosomal protein S18 acetylase RimI-like enzyme